ncbi:3-hydroxybutyrate oligomer hydrolase family protein [Dokdonella fugitiva]|uniref:3-hydroxybutyrate oligomer hydrolase family protein n=1 Tax=Dokdonella fugitiva TaxID=328517 RepID=UPI0015F79C04|nr:3-hydroxybutyrate oligomer hydrolase family protein [Dokdonella fugitiva]MBA8882800.1 hydroxybutyrate-dimer hydrolase [Dokdonella fugitiva]
MTTNGFDGDVRESVHCAGDDLLSAALGLDGLRGKPPAFADAAAPTPQELRRRAIHASWNGIADLGPLGGYGRVYGAVPDVPGREYQAFARVPGARSPHRVLLQAPDAFDARARCLVVAASSGSRGVYGAIALAGAWALPRGCAVACTDKGTGSGYFDLDSDSGVALDGTRAARGATPLEFEPAPVAGATGVAVKHAQSGDNPEADWGRHVLQAARFGLAMLDRAYPLQAPFTPANTRVIVTGVSNGAGAALQAAGLDTDGFVDGVVALAPNVHVEGARPLYDVASEAAQLLPCALTDARYDATPFARVDGAVPPPWLARCAHLRERGLVDGADREAQARSAIERLRAGGWDEHAIETAASSTRFDLWRAIVATYAASYLRATPATMPCGFRYAAVDARGAAVAANAATRATWWSDASGIPPGAAVQLLGGVDASSADPAAPGIDCLRASWTGDDAAARALRAAVGATRVQLPREDLPLVVIHGEDDGLLPEAFHSRAYIGALEAAGREPAYWRVPHAQHFDAFLPLPGFGDRHVPLLPYGYAALDALWSHLADGAPMPHARRFATTPRGAASLEHAALGLGR